MAPNEIIHWLWVFFIYAFIGWCAEVIFHAVTEGKFVNRGFLNGPLCPIYGFGVLLVVFFLEPIKDNLLLLFLCSVVFSSTLELITGFVLERFFNDKWWDYSNEPLNFLGYICLRFSILWGLSCVLIVYAVYPATTRFIALLPQNLSIPLLGLFLVLTLLDTVYTTIETFKLKKTLVFLETTESRIRKISDRIGGVLADGTLTAVEKLEESRKTVLLEKAKAKASLSAVQVRLLNAYPHLKRGKYKNSVFLLMHRFKKINEFGKTGMLSVPFEKPKSIYKDRSVALYKNTVETVIDVLEARDEYTAGHSRRVAILTNRFCKLLNIPPLEAEVFELSASLHDLGKVGVPDATLNKNDKLDDSEWSEIRRHPDIGADIILRSVKLDMVADIVRHHHERWNGNGYPKGISGNDIPKGSQIIAICDAVDSMMIERVYRQALSPQECKAELASGKGKAFNPEMIEVFLVNWDKIVSELYVPAAKTDVSSNSHKL